MLLGKNPAYLNDDDFPSLGNICVLPDCLLNVSEILQDLLTSFDSLSCYGVNPSVAKES